MGAISVRYADQADLEFVSQDGQVPADVVKRKIDLRHVVVAELGDLNGDLLVGCFVVHRFNLFSAGLGLVVAGFPGNLSGRAVPGM